MGIIDLFKKKGNVNNILKEGLNEEKRDMIRGVVDLSDTAVKEVMIPRIDVDFLALDTPGDEILDRISESGHSRFPVYDESIDNVIGILYVKDIIKLLTKNQKIELDKIVRRAFFVPESKRIDALLAEFKRRHIHIAVAVDEYGGVSGIAFNGFGKVVQIDTGIAKPNPRGDFGNILTLIVKFILYIAYNLFYDVFHTYNT